MTARRRRHRVALRGSRVRYQAKMFWLGIFVWTRRLFVLGLLGWLTATGYALWKKSEWLRVQKVEIDPAAPAWLAGRLEVGPGDHFFGFSARAKEERLLREFPELAEVKISRTPDRGLRVAVKRRVPAARVPAGDDWAGIDSAGVVFPLKAAEAAADAELPVLAGAPAGAKALPALEFLASLRALDAPWTRRVAKLKREPAGEIVIVLNEGTPVHWGALPRDADELKRKAARLERVLAHEALAGGAEYVRFVGDDRLAAKPKKHGVNKGE